MAQKRKAPAKIEKIFNEISKELRTTCARSMVCMLINASSNDYKLTKVENIHGEYGNRYEDLGYVGRSPDIIKAGESFIFACNSNGFMTGCQTNWHYVNTVDNTDLVIKLENSYIGVTIAEIKRQHEVSEFIQDRESTRFNFSGFYVIE